MSRHNFHLKLKFTTHPSTINFINLIKQELYQLTKQKEHRQNEHMFITKDKSKRAMVKESPSPPPETSVIDSIGPIELDLVLQNFQLDGHMHALKLFKINKWVNALL